MVSVKEYLEIKDKIYNHEKFDLEKKYKKFEFDLSSNTAACDFYGAKEGDYIILTGWALPESGGGSPITQNKFDKYFGDYETFLTHVNKHNPYTKDKTGQISIFDMIGV